MLIEKLKVQDLVRVDSQDVMGVDKGFGPSIETYYSETLELPLSFLPLQCALLLDEPPKSGTIDQVEHAVPPSNGSDMVVRMFVSHR